MESYSMGQRAFAEALGTALLVLVGPGSVVATLVLAGDSTPAITGADLLGISFAFGLIITALVYALGKVSGCHINPAVTFALAVTKRFPWREVPIYWGAQVAGGVVGALGIWAIFASTAIDLGMGQTSFNEDTATYVQAIFAEGIGTFMLMFADHRDRRLEVAQRLRRHRHRRRRDRDHHAHRPDDRRLAEPGARVRARARLRLRRRRRPTGPSWSPSTSCPAWSAPRSRPSPTTRSPSRGSIERPIKTAVTEPDSGDVAPAN